MKIQLLILGCALAMANPAQAQTPNRTVVVTGPKGQEATRTVTATPTSNGRILQRTVTGPQGQSLTGSGSVTRDNGSRTAVRTVTGPQGQSKTFSKTTSVQR